MTGNDGEELFFEDFISYFFQPHYPERFIFWALFCLQMQKKNPKPIIVVWDNYLFFIGFSLHGSQLYFLLQFHYIFFEQTVGVHKIFYSLATVNNSSMVAAAKMLSNRF